jgi:hypothetical protein
MLELQENPFRHFSQRAASMSERGFSPTTVTLKINVIFKEIDDVESRNKSGRRVGDIYITWSELNICIMNFRADRLDLGKSTEGRTVLCFFRFCFQAVIVFFNRKKLAHVKC